MKILMIGDIVGEPGRRAVSKGIASLREREQIDFVIANAENSAAGSGITAKIYNELISCGVDVLTSGDHVFKKKEIVEILNFHERLIRPANYPDEVPGSGYVIVRASNGEKVGVINVNGRVFMEPLDCPFRKAQELIKKSNRKRRL